MENFEFFFYPLFLPLCQDLGEEFSKAMYYDSFALRSQVLRSQGGEKFFKLQQKMKI